MAARERKLAELETLLNQQQLDGLSDEELERLVVAADEDEELAGRLAKVQPPAVEVASTVPPVSNERWEEMWSEIETGRRSPSVVRGRRLVTWLAPTSIAAAACVALALLWQWGGGNIDGPGVGRVELARSVEIHEVEADSGLAMVLGGTENNPSVLWVFDEGGA